MFRALSRLILLNRVLFKFKQNFQEIKNKANELRLTAQRNPADQRVLNELFATNLRLEKLLQYKTTGAILRSKVRWFENSERNTKYFLI